MGSSRNQNTKKASAEVRERTKENIYHRAVGLQIPSKQVLKPLKTNPKYLLRRWKWSPRDIKTIINLEKQSLL